MTPSDVLKLAKEKGAQIVDLRFIDMPGLWQHFSIPVAELTAELFAEGIGFDGSSIRGFQAINESDMLLFPDPATAQMDPFTAVPTLVLICDVKDPVTGANYGRDPRYVAKKAEAYVKSTGIADTDLHRPRARVLHLRRRALRPGLQLRLLPPRLRERPLEQRPRGHAGESRTSATARAPSRATSRCRPPTTTRTCARRW